MFGPLKEVMGGKKFCSDEEGRETKLNCFKIPK
jgi:hypothetical protein